MRRLSDIDAWLRVLSRCDAAFVDEELTVRWHHAGSATDAFAGSATLDKMWVLSDLIRSDELDFGAVSARGPPLAEGLRALPQGDPRGTSGSARHASQKLRGPSTILGHGATASVRLGRDA